MRSLQKRKHIRNEVVASDGSNGLSLAGWESDEPLPRLWLDAESDPDQPGVNPAALSADQQSTEQSEGRTPLDRGIPQLPRAHKDRRRACQSRRLALVASRLY
jgi:hypothetical protein